MYKKDILPASAAIALSSVLSCTPAQQQMPVTAPVSKAVVVDVGPGTVKSSEVSVASEQRHGIQCALEKDIPSYRDLVASLPKEFKDDYTAYAKMGMHTARAMSHLANELDKEPNSSLTLDNICVCQKKMAKETEEATQGVGEACDPMKVTPKPEYESARLEFCKVAKETVEDMPEITNKLIQDCKEIAEFNAGFPYEPTQYKATQIERLKLNVTHWRFKMDSLWTPMYIIKGVGQMDKR